MCQGHIYLAYGWCCRGDDGGQAGLHQILRTMVRPLQALEACLGSAHGGAGASYMGFPAGKSGYWMFSNGPII